MDKLVESLFPSFAETNNFRKFMSGFITTTSEVTDFSCTALRKARTEFCPPKYNFCLSVGI